jgi:hypothetical protein
MKLLLGLPRTSIASQLKEFGQYYRSPARGRRDDLIDLLRAHLKPSMNAYISSYNRRFDNGSE